MAFNVTSLTNWTKANENMLVVKSFFSPKTASYMQKLPDVKSAIQIPDLSDTLVWQAGGTCGLINASGDTTITSRTLTVGRIKVEKAWCIADLEAKYTQLLLAPGSNYEALPGGIDQAFMETLIGEQAEAVESALWRADTTRWQDYLNKFDGLVKIINAASGTTQANAAAYGTPVTSITVSNVIAVLQMVYQAIPTAILDKPDTKIFISTNVSRLYQTALINANLYNFIPAANSMDEYYLHGTNVKIVPVPGLNVVDGTDKEAIYCLRTKQMFEGFDTEAEGSGNAAKIWYSEDYDTVYLRMKFKLGTQVAIPSQIVKFTL